MAIDRVTPSSAALTIPERVARERPGQQQPAPARASAVQEPFDAGVPGAVGALLEAMEGKLPSAPTTLARTLAAEALLADAASMQPNQLFMARQLTWHAPDPSAMAASWMAMIRTYAEQRNALLAQAHGRHVPASLFMSEGAQHALREGRLPQQLVSELDAWRFAVYAWGAEKLVLRVVTRDDGEDDDAQRTRTRHSGVALRLEVHLPGLGKVVLQMEPVQGGVVLEVGAAQAAAMARLRALLPEIGAIARRCGAHVLRVRLMRELPAPGHREPGAMQIAMLTPPVFKAMAEVAVLLSQPQRDDAVFYQP